MTNPKSPNKPAIFQVGDTVFYKEHDWEVAEIRGKEITLFYDRIDGQSESERITSKELQEALIH